MIHSKTEFIGGIFNKTRRENCKPKKHSKYIIVTLKAKEQKKELCTKLQRAEKRRKTQEPAPRKQKDAVGTMKHAKRKKPA